MRSCEGSLQPLRASFHRLPKPAAHDGSFGAGQAWLRVSAQLQLTCGFGTSHPSSLSLMSLVYSHFLCLSVHAGALRCTLLLNAIICHLSHSQVPQTSLNFSHIPRTAGILLCTNSPCTQKPAIYFGLKPLPSVGF